MHENVKATNSQVVVVGGPSSVHYSTLGLTGYILEVHTYTCGDFNTLPARGCHLFMAAGVTLDQASYISFTFMSRDGVDHYLHLAIRLSTWRQVFNE